MKRQQVYFLLGAALVLAIAGAVFQLVRSSGWKGQATDLEPFANLPVNSVEKLVVKSSKQTTTLQKVSDIWTVAERNGFPADFGKIRELMTALWEFKVVRQSDIGPSQFGRLNIIAPGQGDHSGIELDLVDGSGKLIKSLIFGKLFGGNESSGDQDQEDSVGNGRFVYDPSQKDKVYLTSENFDSVDASPQNWLDKDFIKADDIKDVARVSSPDGEGWEISKKDAKAPWDLVNAKPGETLNTQAVAALGNFAPSIQDVKPANTPDSETGLNKPVTVNLATFDGFKYALEIGGTGPDQSRFCRFKVSANLPSQRVAEPSESPDDKKKKDDEFNKNQEALKVRLTAEQKLQKWIFEVDNDSVEAFLKPRKDLLKAVSPTTAQKPAAVTGVLPRPSVSSPLAATPTPGVSPASLVPSPSPESSATPETKASPEPLATTPTPGVSPASVVPSPSPESLATPETKASPEPLATTPTPAASPASVVPSPSPESSATPQTKASPEAVPSTSPIPSATPGG
jgi:hypothetical protein